KSYVRATFSSALQDLTAIGDFDLTQQGPSGSGNVPLFRFFDSSSKRLVSLYRQNVSSGTSSTIYVNYGGTYYPTSGKLTLGSWATLGIHLIFNGAASTVTISLNGSQIYSTTSANLGTAGISTIQIGNETAAQQFTALVDNVSVQTGTAATTPPTNTSPPTISGTPQSGQTLNASPGTWNGSQPINYAYQWQRCDTNGNNCTPISGATGPSYPLTGSDVGATLDVVVTASNTAGSSTATSTATAVIQPGSLPPNIVALWHMDETSGTTMYDSAGNHNGTLYKVQTGLAGWSGSAYGFNGASSYASVPSSPELNPGSANITMTIHLKTTGTPPPPPADWDIFRKGLYTSVGGEYKMEFQQSGQASCGFEGSGGYAEIQGGPALNDGNWHTIACAKTATQIQLIVDGTLVASKNATIGTIAPSDPVVIGARPGSDWYQGQLDEASIQIG
ncbi:MAG TPA: LamG-like jellyroll fold domain-containing protein, partial [Gaiellaceae bacterium]|nr:LamG-like jellyroll fold domain-containing protein [Gaiellaceae bacterium]